MAINRIRLLALFLLALGAWLPEAQAQIGPAGGWPPATDIVVSTGVTSSPIGLAPVNGQCVVGVGSAWTAGSCTGSAAVSSVSGTAGQIVASPTVGNVILTLPGTITSNEIFSGTTTLSGPTLITGLPTRTQVSCLGLDSGNNVVLNAAGCNNAASAAFSAITSGNNTTAAMVVGSGATLAAVGSGSITSTQSLTTLTSTSAAFFIPFVAGAATGNQTFDIGAGLSYNPGTNILSVGGATFTGLSSGTQVSCLGLNSLNAVVLNLAACGSGGGSSAFNAITSGTNTAAAMVVGTGASLGVSGTGTINATTLGGATFAAPGSIGSGTASPGFFTTLNASGNVIFSSLLGSGTITGAVCIDAGGHVINNATTNCFGGASGSLTVQDSLSHSVLNTTVIALGTGFIVSGSGGTANVASTLNDFTHNVSATINVGGQDNFLGSSLTATVPNTSGFGNGQTAFITNQSGSALTISNGLTINGLPLSTTLHAYGFYGYTGNGSSADAFGFPGYGTITTNTLGEFMDATGAMTASTIVDNGSGVVVGAATGGAKGPGTINSAGQIYINNVPVGSGGGGSITVQDLNGHSYTGTGVLAFQNGFSVSQPSSGTVNAFSLVPDGTTTASCTVGTTSAGCLGSANGDMGSLINANGSSLTITLNAPSGALFTNGSAIQLTNFNSTVLTINGTATINGCPWGGKIYQGGFEAFTANAATTLDCAGWPGFGAVSGAVTITAAGVATLAAPTASVLGGILSSAAPTNQFATGVTTGGGVTYAQPLFSNIGGSVITSQLGNGYSDGNMLIGSSVDGQLHVADLSAGTNVSIVNGHGTVTINATASPVILKQMLSFNSNGTATSSNSTQYVASGVSTTPGDIQITSALPGTFKNMYVNTSAQAGYGQSFTMTFDVNGYDTNITCGTGAYGTSCNDTSHTAAITAGQTYVLKVLSSASAAVAKVGFGIEFDPGATACSTGTLDFSNACNSALIL